MITVRALLLLVFAIAAVAPLEAQIPANSMAYTYCDGNRARTVVDIEVVGGEEYDELVVHEAKHREQIARFLPFCPVFTAGLLLDWEIEAYCVSRPVAMRRRQKSKMQVDIDYITRITFGLAPAFSADSVARVYFERCP